MRLAEVQMQKAILWEEAKGKLRTMVTVDGFKRLADPTPTLDRDQELTRRWEHLDQQIEDFITHIENEGLCE